MNTGTKGLSRLEALLGGGEKWLRKVNSSIANVSVRVYYTRQQET
jgi:hypothetical protein